MRGVDHREPLDLLGLPGGHPPGDDPAPIVADHGSAGTSGRIDRPLHIIRERVEGIGRDRSGFFAAGVAALIGDEEPEAGIGQGTDLGSPAVPELREAVQQDHRRPIFRAQLDDMKPDSISRNHRMSELVIHRAHVSCFALDDLRRPGRRVDLEAGSFIKPPGK
jgi:hypothetical protein